MKKICKILIALGIIMGCATSVKANAQEAENTNDTVKVFGEIYATNAIQCEINQVFYEIDAKRTHAIAVWAEAEDPVLEIPSSVNLNGVQYPVTKFDPGINHEGYYERGPAIDHKSYEEIKLPDSVLEVRMGITTGCKKINIPKHAKASLEIDVDNTTVTIPEDHDYYTLKDNFVYDKKDNTKIYYVLGVSGNVQIPEGVKYVGSLLQNSNIKKLSLPSTLEQIGVGFAVRANMETADLSKTKLKKIPEKAFWHADDLQKIKLPAALLEIDKNAFGSCGLEEIVIPDKVTKIRANAFAWCPKLKKISISSKISVIGAGAFTRCKQLKKVIFKGTKKMPTFGGKEGVFGDARSGIKFYTKNEKMAKQLKKKLKNSRVKKAKIYAGKKKKLIYKNVNG